MVSLIASCLIVTAQVAPLPPVNLQRASVLIDRGSTFKYIPPRIVRTAPHDSVGDEMRLAWADCSKVINAPYTQDDFDVAWKTFTEKIASIQAREAALRAALDAAYKAQ